MTEGNESPESNRAAGEDLGWQVYRDMLAGCEAARRGDVDEAVASFERVLASRPDYTDAHHWRVYTLAEAKRLPEALAASMEWLERCPDSEPAVSTRCWLLHESGDRRGAWRYIDGVLRSEPDTAAGCLCVANLCGRYGLAVRAAEAIRRAETLGADTKSLAGTKGRLAAQCGDYDGAIEHYHTEWDCGDVDRDLMMRVAWAFHKARRYSSLLEWMREWVAREPDWADAWFYVGYGEEGLGHLDRAAEAFARAIALEPSHSCSRLGLVRTHLKRGRLRDAWRAYRAYAAKLRA